MKTIDEIKHLLSARFRMDRMHDYTNAPDRIKSLGLDDTVLPAVMAAIGVGWKAVELRRVKSAGGVGFWLRVDIVREASSGKGEAACPACRAPLDDHSPEQMFDCENEFSHIMPDDVGAK